MTAARQPLLYDYHGAFVENYVAQQLAAIWAPNFIIGAAAVAKQRWIFYASWKDPFSPSKLKPA